MTNSKNKEEILYHYTNFEGLIGIIQSGEIWASNIHNLNDYEEYQNALKEITSLTSIKNPNKLEKIKEYTSSIDAVHTFIASFTTEYDLLSQWRGFCPNGGVAIGFKKQHIEKIITLPVFDNQYSHIALKKCVYSTNTKQKTLEPLLADLNDEMKFKIELVKVAPTFKHEAFTEENEWRIAANLIPAYDERIGIRTRGAGVITYFKLPLEHGKNTKGKRNFGIEHVVISPGCFDRNSEEIHKLFAVKNISYRELRASNIPYRTV